MGCPETFYQLKKMCHETQSLKKQMQREESKRPGLLAVTYVNSQSPSVACFLLDMSAPPRSYENWWKRKKKRWCFAKWKSQYPSNRGSSWSHVYQSCASIVSCPAKPVHRAKCPLLAPMPCEWPASCPRTLLPHPGAFSRLLTPWKPTFLSPVRLWLFCFPFSTLGGNMWGHDFIPE